MDTLGAAVGPILAILLMSLNPGDLRRLYFWAVIPGLFSVLVAFTVREQKATTIRHEWKNPLSARNELSGAFKKYLYAWGLFSLTNSSDTFLLMRAKSIGLSTQTVILLFCAYNLTYSLSSPWLGTLSDKIGRKSLMVAGLCIYSLVYLGFGFASQGWDYWGRNFVHDRFKYSHNERSWHLYCERVRAMTHKLTLAKLTATLTTGC